MPWFWGNKKVKKGQTNRLTHRRAEARWAVSADGDILPKIAYRKLQVFILYI